MTAYDRTQWLVIGGHLTIALVLVAVAVLNYRSTGDPVSALPPLAIAVMIAVLGRSVARVVAKD
jgi:CDP-diglyceride synthetase